jgi:hypothetical protein
MRTPRKIKQPLIYALLIRKEPIYERDKDGNIIYKIIGGEKIPKTTGEKRGVYSDPITFYNTISGDLTENELQAFGTQNNASAKMTYKRDQYPFKTGTLIWKQSEVLFLDDGTPDPTSADYRIIGVMPEGQYFWKCLLEAVVKNEKASP